MKVGPRKPSPKRSVRAATTARVERAAKAAVNPFYGKKGVGFAHDPKRAVYNAAYQRATFDVRNLATGSTPSRRGQGGGGCGSSAERSAASVHVSRSGKSVKNKGESLKLKWPLGSFANLSDSMFRDRARELLFCCGWDLGGWKRDSRGHFCAEARRDGAPCLVYSLDSGKAGVDYVRGVRSEGAAEATIWVLCRAAKEDSFTWQALKLARELDVTIVDGSDLDDYLVQEALLRLPFSPRIGTAEQKDRYEAMLSEAEGLSETCESRLSDLADAAEVASLSELDEVGSKKTTLGEVQVAVNRIRRRYGKGCRVVKDPVEKVLEGMGIALAEARASSYSACAQAELLVSKIRERHDRECRDAEEGFGRDFALVMEKADLLETGIRGMVRSSKAREHVEEMRGLAAELDAVADKYHSKLPEGLLEGSKEQLREKIAAAEGRIKSAKKAKRAFLIVALAVLLLAAAALASPQEEGDRNPVHPEQGAPSELSGASDEAEPMNAGVKTEHEAPEESFPQPAASASEDERTAEYHVLMAAVKMAGGINGEISSYANPKGEGVFFFQEVDLLMNVTDLYAYCVIGDTVFKLNANSGTYVSSRWPDDEGYADVWARSNLPDTLRITVNTKADAVAILNSL